MLRFTIVCGPTGGHLIPALLVAEELQQRDCAVTLVSSASVDQSLLQNFEGKYIQLNTQGWQGGVVGKLRCLLKTAGSLKKSFQLLSDSDAVISFGGYPAVPVLTAAVLKRIPLFIQEQNRLMGRANRLFLSRSQECFWGFPPAGRSVSNSDLIVGNPVRRRPPRPRPSSNPLLVVVGGSQGALSLSRLLKESLDYFRKENWAVFYVKGKFGLDLRAETRDFADFEQVDFEPDLPAWIGSADCVWSRAGAGALSEIAYYGTPALLFPFGAAADDHQRINAEFLSECGPARLVGQLSSEQRFETTLELSRQQRDYKLPWDYEVPPEKIIAEHLIERVKIDD